MIRLRSVIVNIGFAAVVVPAAMAIFLMLVGGVVVRMRRSDSERGWPEGFAAACMAVIIGSFCALAVEWVVGPLASMMDVGELESARIWLSLAAFSVVILSVVRRFRLGGAYVRDIPNGARVSRVYGHFLRGYALWLAACAIFAGDLASAVEPIGSTSTNGAYYPALALLFVALSVASLWTSHMIGRQAGNVAGTGMRRYIRPALWLNSAILFAVAIWLGLQAVA